VIEAEALTRKIIETFDLGAFDLIPVTRRLIRRFVGQPPPKAVEGRVLERLTNREAEVLRLVARGLSNAQIAGELVVSETTVKSHVARLLMKLGLHDRVQAVVLAYETGFVQPGSA
jgi:DNA-binding NarL/FixJ family response regulator